MLEEIVVEELGRWQRGSESTAVNGKGASVKRRESPADSPRSISHLFSIVFLRFSYDFRSILTVEGRLEPILRGFGSIWCGALGSRPRAEVPWRTSPSWAPLQQSRPFDAPFWCGFRAF